MLCMIQDGERNIDEVVEKGYMKAADTISNFYGKDYKKGDPNKDEQFLKASEKMIKYFIKSIW